MYKTNDNTEATPHVFLYIYSNINIPFHSYNLFRNSLMFHIFIELQLQFIQKQLNMFQPVRACLSPPLS